MVLSLPVFYLVVVGSMGLLLGLFTLLRIYSPDQLDHDKSFLACHYGVNLLSGGLRSQAFFGYFAIIALTSLLLGARPSLGITFLCIVAGTVRVLYRRKPALLASVSLLPPCLPCGFLPVPI